VLAIKKIESNSFHLVLCVEKTLNQEKVSLKNLVLGTTVIKQTKTKKDLHSSKPSTNSNHEKTQSTNQSEYAFTITTTKVRMP